MYKDDGGSSYSASTDFEKFDHASMLDMVQNADPAKVIALAQKLDKVSTKTESIATDLQTHMSKVDWDGKGGDAFRDWGSRVASATMTLSDYSSNASVFMLNAGQVLSDVKRDMPQVPSIPYHTVSAYRAKNGLDGHYSDTAGVTTTHLDGAYGPYNADPSAAEYKSAEASLETSRSLAVDQMNKLGQAYNMATDVIKTSPEPTFPPTPTAIMPTRPKNTDLDSDSSYVPGDTGGTGGSGKVHLQHVSVPNFDSTGSDSGSSSVPPGGLTPVTLPPDKSVHLDSITTLPVNTSSQSPFPMPTGPIGPGPSPTGPPGGTPFPMPTSLFPPPTGNGPDFNPNELNTLRSNVQWESQNLGGNLSENPSGNMSNYGPLGGRGPFGGGLGTEPPPVSTITGGRPSLSGVDGEGNAIPRGNVIGGGGGIGGLGGGAGGGLGGGAGGGTGRGAYMAPGGGSGGRSGRGGVVGETRAENGGTLGVPSTTGPRAGRNFTAGGEGLNRQTGLPADRIAEESAEGERLAPGMAGTPLGGGVREHGRRARRRRGRHGRDGHEEQTTNPADGQE